MAGGSSWAKRTWWPYARGSLTMSHQILLRQPAEISGDAPTAHLLAVAHLLADQRQHHVDRHEADLAGRRHHLGVARHDGIGGGVVWQNAHQKQPELLDD